MAGDRLETPWQQGFILNADSVKALGLTIPDGGDDLVAVLITHDCDLVEALELEPFCEVIVGVTIDEIEGTYTNAKNPRQLHLTFSGGETSISAAFVATNRKLIPKADFLKHSPAEKIRLKPEEHFTLQAWLAERYQRPILPDEFDRRLKTPPGEVHKKLARAVSATSTDIVAVLFDIDRGKSMDRKDADDVYELAIFLIYKISEDEPRAKATASKLAARIKDIFRAAFFVKGKWQNIELRTCVPVSEDVVSIYQWSALKPWYFDYLDLAARVHKPKAEAPGG